MENDSHSNFALAAPYKILNLSCDENVDTYVNSTYILLVIEIVIEKELFMHDFLFFYETIRQVFVVVYHSNNPMNPSLSMSLQFKLNFGKVVLPVYGVFDLKMNFKKVLLHPHFWK